MTTSTSDVVIVGGGIVGAATAYYLACRGIASTVVERDRVAAHASGFSYAALGTFDEAGMDGAHFDVASEGMRLHRELADLLPAETGTQTDFRDRPQLWLAFTDEEMEEARNPTGWAKRKQEWEVDDQGQRVRIVDADEARRIEPRITPSALGAVYTEGTADVNAHRLTVALAAAAEKRGATIRTGAVVDVERSGGRVTGVVLESGRIDCGSVVVAMGPWSESASDWLGVPIRMSPWKGQILRLRLPGSPIECSVAGYDHFASTKPDGLVWVGPTFEDAGIDETTTPEGREEIMAEVVKIVPSLAEGELALHTACVRPLSADRKLILGRVPGLEGAYAATGGGRLGLMMGPAMGSLTAELIATGSTSVPLDEFDPGRFAE